MKSNAIISEMFEEIKAQLVAIEKKLNGQDSRLKVNDEERKSKNNRTAIESVLKQISSYLSTIYLEATEIPGKIQQSQQKVLSNLEQVQATVTKQEKERIIHHRHVIDIRSSKVILTLVALAFALLGAIVGNVYQYKKALKMADNDLKYRYIHMLGGINKENLSTLEDIFQDHQNKKLIHKIREEVEDFEKGVRKQAEETERK